MRWWIEEGNSTWRIRREELLICSYPTKADAQKMLNHIAFAYDLLDDYPSLLADVPHPKLPESELTARDYAIWLLANAQYPGMWRALDLVFEAYDALPAEPSYEGTNVIPFPVKKKAERKSA
jgi:hypothetical protein